MQRMNSPYQRQSNYLCQILINYASKNILSYPFLQIVPILPEETSHWKFAEVERQSLGALLNNLQSINQQVFSLQGPCWAGMLSSRKIRSLANLFVIHIYVGPQEREFREVREDLLVMFLVLPNN